MIFSMPFEITGKGDEPYAFDQGMSETEIAWVANEWLIRTGWETYPEVVVEGFPGRPDLVATRNNFCQVLECKRGFNLTVVDQATRWQLCARPDQTGIPHLIWIVVQRPKASCNRNWLLNHVMREFGIGMIVIDKKPAFEWRYDTEREVRPQHYRLYGMKAPRTQPVSRRTAKLLIDQLKPDMRIATPGSRGGQTEYMTPFKRTISSIERLLADGEPYHIDHIIDWLNSHGGHHYGSDESAKSTLPRHLDRLGYLRARKYGPWFCKPMDSRRKPLRQC